METVAGVACARMVSEVLTRVKEPKTGQRQPRHANGPTAQVDLAVKYERFMRTFGEFATRWIRGFTGYHHHLIVEKPV